MVCSPSTRSPSLRKITTLQINDFISESPSKTKDENDVNFIGKNCMIPSVDLVSAGLGEYLGKFSSVFCGYQGSLASEKTTTELSKTKLNDRFFMKRLSRRTMIILTTPIKLRHETRCSLFE